jgi:hypothetical protein
MFVIAIILVLGVYMHTKTGLSSYQQQVPSSSAFLPFPYSSTLVLARVLLTKTVLQTRNLFLLFPHHLARQSSHKLSPPDAFPLFPHKCTSLSLFLRPLQSLHERFLVHRLSPPLNFDERHNLRVFQARPTTLYQCEIRPVVVRVVYCHGIEVAQNAGEIHFLRVGKMGIVAALESVVVAGDEFVAAGCQRGIPTGIPKGLGA